MQFNGTAAIQPAGIVVPSEKVKSFITLRFRPTGEQTKCKLRQDNANVGYIRELKNENRIDSFMKLSSFRSFPMAAFVQPSSWTTASISSRKGCIYSE